MIDYKKYILCMEYEGKLFFTRKNLEEQWGDDWNDSPYDCNAGTPYYDNDTDLIAVYAEPGPKCSDFQYPRYSFHTGPFLSVKDINSGAAPWISYKKFEKDKTISVNIPAGICLEDFEKIIFRDGGTIYYPRKE